MQLGMRSYSGMSEGSLAMCLSCLQECDQMCCWQTRGFMPTVHTHGRFKNETGLAVNAPG